MLGRVVSEVVEEYGFDIANITIVTDNATHMVAAFCDRCCRLSCFAHCLNLVMVDVLATENGDFSVTTDKLQIIGETFYASFTSKKARSHFEA